MAHALADSGVRLLVLERGDFVPREEENWNPEAVWKHLRYRVREQWIDRSGEEFRPYTHYCVGETPSSGAASCIAFAVRTFRRWNTSTASRRRGRSIMRRWNCYDRAERLYDVRGQHGADPSEAPRSPFPFDAVPHAPVMARIVERSAARAESFVAAARFAETWPGGWLRPVQHLQFLPVQGSREKRRRSGLHPLGRPASHRDALDQRARAAAAR